jgi:drug/metabolite transporter (DMT)-like permease
LIHRAQILAAAALFSTGGALVKACSLTGWQVASFRSAVAALVLAAALPAWRRFWSPRSLAVGAAYGATMLLFVTGNKLTTAANTIFLQATAPIYLLVLGPWWLGERVRGRDLAFAAALGCGLGLFFLGLEPATRTAPDPLRGNVLAAISGFTWALTLTGLRWLGRTPSPPGRDAAGESVVAGNVLAFGVTLPLALPVARAPVVDWVMLGFLGAVQIGLAYALLARGVRHVRALEAGLLLLLEPVMNALLAWAVHGEMPGAWSLAGCAVILVATVVRTLRG